MKKIVYILTVIIIATAAFSATYREWTNGSGDQVFTRGSNWFDLSDGYVFTTDDRPRINLSGSDAAILSSDVTCDSLYLGSQSGATGELTITGGTNSFANCAFASSDDSTGILNVSGGDTSFSGYFTVGNTGYGNCTVDSGVLTVNRSQLGQNTGSSGDYFINGGEFNIEDKLVVGAVGTGGVTMTGGTLNVMTGELRIGAYTNTGVGAVTLSGTSEFNCLNSYTELGDEGYGEININGGTLNLDRISIGRNDDPNSKGYLFITDGAFNCEEYCTIGTNGEAGVEVSGGALNVNRMTIAQGSVSESFPTTGYLKITGGEVNSETYIEVGRDGTATFTLEGDAGEVNLANFEVNGLSTVEFALNGSAGVGKGVAAFGGTEMDGFDEITIEGNVLLKEGAVIDPSFMSGTDKAGDYAVICSSESLTYLPETEPDEDYAVDLPAGDMADFLTSTAVSAGWSATLYNSGSGSAVVLSSPVAATETVWSSAGTDDIAVVDDGSEVLSTSKTANGAVIGDTMTGSLDVSTGAAGQFVNLTAARDAGSSGSITMTDGAVDVESVAYIGKEGDATVDISGGSFSAFNLIASSGADASADITVSGDASFDAGNLLAISDGGAFTVSGYETTVNAAELTLGEDANLAFELDENHGVGNGLVVSGNVTLAGTVSVDTLGARLEQTYTVLRAEGVIFDETDDLVDSPFVSYEIVENGDYQELQVTFFTPESCEDVIDGGFALAADANNDCYVTIEDFAIMAAQWLTCNDPTDPECELDF